MSETKDMSETNEPIEVCPSCGHDEVINCHGWHQGWLETSYKACEMCNHQWGHE
jgi:hypothetical protein